ncbi:MAG: F420-dependent oxidoreductase, partial [Dermatophilaceae bacterium]|nr:F420-dependent oxidoreductase [Dermatophilaceae bacterium]
MTGPITITPLTGIPEVSEGDDLVDVVQLGLDHAGVSLANGDVLVVSSKIASKALGLVTHDPDKDRVVRGETEYV